VTRCANTTRHWTPTAPTERTRPPDHGDLHPAPSTDNGRAWLRNAMAALAILAAAAAVVSWDAQLELLDLTSMCPAPIRCARRLAKSRQKRVNLAGPASVINSWKLRTLGSSVQCRAIEDSKKCSTGDYARMNKTW